MFTNHILSTDDLIYHKSTMTFVAECSSLPEEFAPSNTTLDEDLPGKKVLILNPDTKKSRWFYHNPETDLVKGPEDEVEAWIYREQTGLKLHLIND